MVIIEEEFAKNPLECNAGVFRKHSNVRIKFIIPKGKFKENIYVDASRIAQKPDHVYYYFNDEQYIDHIKVFHERCRIDVTSLFPCLNHVFANEKRNLMSIWIENECSSLRYDREKSYELVANYLLVSHIRPATEVQNIGKIRNSILTINRHTDILGRQTFIEVANKIGQIFNYITFGKYAVQFHIPLIGQHIRMEEVNWGDMDFSSAETFIENIDGKTSVLWNTMDAGLKYLLKIAQLIALAKNLGQHCIIIDDTTLLKNYQNQEMIKEAIIEDDNTNNGENWKNKNFLNRIVNVCNDMQIMILMNYNGGLPLPLENANILRCTDMSKFPEQQPIYVSELSQQMSLEDFIHIIKPATRMETA
ncbi:uncharacterized protein LOC129953207 isoform X2 [Eupeodes corollae]|uniref:uncharacterized protein LOC129953207 isoform X2 n=1 Tax=Eupeodes corollae TaxID=290404 RepID=UPI00249058BC|nr:uncharacterized protein LOC129953207 isoform X2 [Eupeodes corollae]